MPTLAAIYKAFGKESGTPEVVMATIEGCRNMTSLRMYVSRQNTLQYDGRYVCAAIDKVAELLERSTEPFGTVMAQQLIKKLSEDAHYYPSDMDDLALSSMLWALIKAGTPEAMGSCVTSAKLGVEALALNLVPAALLGATQDQ
eukprot:gene17588-23917_t